MKYIISFQEQSKDICFAELKKINANFKEIESLNSNQSLIQLNLPKQELCKIVKTQPIIFLRHIFSVEFEMQKPINLTNFVNNLSKQLNIDKSFSIQFLTNISHNLCQITTQDLANMLTIKNFCLNVKNPEQIISVFETKNSVYAGIGNEQTNLSNFKAGMPHFSKKNNFISRAEYKLLEAIDLAKINITNMKLAADLGAAPGGWTKVLANNNIKTHAIDPASLSPDIKNNKNVQHFRMTTEEYLKRFSYKNFDIIVNDMKMDINLSTDIILNFYDRLNSCGLVIMTFKLTKKISYNQIIQCIKKLQQKYKIILSRQLFHNRSEITVILQKNI